MLSIFSPAKWGLCLCFVAFISTQLHAIDIIGIQYAGLDQPRINAVLRRSPNGAPLVADFGFGITTINIQAFYDTGASGLLLSDQTADFMGIAKSRFPEPNGPLVSYFDVGVAGAEEFHVSEPLYVGLAPFEDTLDAENPANYTQNFGPIRLQMAFPPSNPLLDGLDVFGMPIFAGKVVVIDPTPVDVDPTIGLPLGTMRTFVYNPGTPFNPNSLATNPGIPPTPYQVQMSYAQLDEFTEVDPVGAPGPTLAHNPFIGPNPVLQLHPNPPTDNTPPVVLGYNGHQTSGSLLLDTGAAASMISSRVAADLHVRYRPGTEGTENPRLEEFDPQNPQLPGTLVPGQYTLEVGGIGGTKKIAGFYLDTMLLRTLQGNTSDFGDPNHLNYGLAPVLVNDISVQNPTTGQVLTIDGLIGTNMFAASTEIIAGPIPSFGDIVDGPFRWVVVDEPNGRFSVQPKEILTPNQWALAGGGNWSEAANWTEQAIPNSIFDQALLGQNFTGGGSVDLQNQTITVAGLRFDNTMAGYTVAASGTGKLILEANGNNPYLTNLLSNTQQHTISAPVEIRGKLHVLAGNQPIQLTGSTTFTSGSSLVIETGTLAFALPQGATSTLPPGITVEVQSGAKLELGGVVSPLGSITGNKAAVITTASDSQLSITAGNHVLGHVSGEISFATPLGATVGQTYLSAGATLSVMGLRLNRLELTAGTANQPTTLTALTTDGGSDGLVLLDNRQANGGSGIPGLILGQNSVLDLQDNDLVLHYSSTPSDPNPGALITQYVDNFFTDTPNLPRIASTTVLNSGGTRIIVPVDNAVANFGDVGNPFYDLTLGNSTAGTGFQQILVRFTFPGDYNLDGKVDGLDYLVVDSNQGYMGSGGVGGWIFGDGNFDGIVDTADYLPVDSYLGSGMGNPLAEATVTATPEPNSAWGLAFLAGLGAGFGLFRRRAKTA
ncbi:MAG: hypothetical protein SFX18_09845 [Pirellulales bacterium]|nr:hypothetical protein [Pirellulales bacterium]